MLFLTASFLVTHFLRNTPRVIRLNLYLKPDKDDKLFRDDTWGWWHIYVAFALCLVEGEGGLGSIMHHILIFP